MLPRTLIELCFDFPLGCVGLLAGDNVTFDWPFWLVLPEYNKTLATRSVTYCRLIAAMTSILSRSNFVGLQFSQVALELMASPAVELRSIGIRLLILYLAGPEGKLDSKQVAAFEKINGFHTMARQLSSHSSCDEVILEGLFALLFWQVKGLIPASSPSSTEMSSKGNVKGEIGAVS